jgi:hypothetical protein
MKAAVNLLWVLLSVLGAFALAHVVGAVNPSEKVNGLWLVVVAAACIYMLAIGSMASGKATTPTLLVHRLPDVRQANIMVTNEASRRIPCRRSMSLSRSARRKTSCWT